MSEGSNPWKTFAIGCGVIALLGCCCCGISMALLGGKLIGPAQTTGTFFTALQAGNFDVAYDQMAPDFQATHPKAGFAAELATLPGATSISNMNVNGANSVNGVTTVTGFLQTSAGAQPFSLEIVSVGDADKIRSITVGSVTLR